MSAAASVVWAAAAAAAGAARTPTEAWLRPARVAGHPPGGVWKQSNTSALLAGGFRSLPVPGRCHGMVECPAAALLCGER